MADTKISALPAATTPLAGTEVLPIVQSGTTDKVAVSDLTAGRDVLTKNITAGTTSVANTQVSVVASASNDANEPEFNLSSTVFANLNTPRVKSANGTLALLVESGSTSTFQNRMRLRLDGGGAATTTLQASTNNGTAYTDRVTIAGATGDMTLNTGNLLAGTTNNGSSARIMCNGGLAVQTNGNGNRSMLVNLVSNENFNGAATAIYVGRDGTTSRSINAGGTVNAAGLDYAEYMVKASDFIVAKGDVVGINAQGKLTNVFADAVSFVVKSTNPSYVGGDTWGTEEALSFKRPETVVRILDEIEHYLVSEATEDQEAVYETIVTKAGDSDQEWAAKEAVYLAEKAAFDIALESARALVDRVAFAGQVPVNVLGATAGQYIVPVDDNGSIKGQAVSNPTFEQYQSAVGKVIAIEADGRARIIVKVA